MMCGRLERWQDIRELVLMSVGTDKGRWWADRSFGSELWLLMREGKVTDNTAGRVRQMVLDSLQWLIDDGLALKIECEAFRAGKTRIDWSVRVLKPDGRDECVKEVWDGVC